MYNQILLAWQQYMTMFLIGYFGFSKTRFWSHSFIKLESLPLTALATLYRFHFPEPSCLKTLGFVGGCLKDRRFDGRRDSSDACDAPINADTKADHRAITYKVEYYGKGLTPLLSMYDAPMRIQCLLIYVKDIKLVNL